MYKEEKNGYCMECCYLIGDFCDNDCKEFCEKDQCCCYNPQIYPKLSQNWAMTCNLINWFPLTAGVGTILSAFITCPDGCSMTKIIAMGLVQALFTPIIFGYIWSIKHGLWLHRLANTDVVTKIKPSGQTMPSS